MNKPYWNPPRIVAFTILAVVVVSLVVFVGNPLLIALAIVAATLTFLYFVLVALCGRWNIFNTTI